MASVDKVKVDSTTYDISPSKNGTLRNYTSGDSSSPTNWTTIQPIVVDDPDPTKNDTNATIFNKLTTMVKNVRWLYAKLGTTDFSSTGSDTVTGALVSLKNRLNGKANSNHSHTVSQLPVTSNQSNSTSTIPTCALLYSMNQELDTLEAAADNIINVLDNPNKRTQATTNLGTWSSISDVNTFFSRFTHYNNYAYGALKLAVGNYVTIQDGTYNAQWEIAGFDLEHNQTAADGTVYNNGYGICMIPRDFIMESKWHTKNTIHTGSTGGYITSNMHTTVLPGVVNTLKTVLGTHVVTRNVLLSNGRNTQGFSTGYTWTTADATLMSCGQVNGTFASNRNKYDDGEATYRLPVFVSKLYTNSEYYWVRSIFDGSHAYLIKDNGTTDSDLPTESYGVRPLIYLR